MDFHFELASTTSTYAILVSSLDPAIVIALPLERFEDLGEPEELYAKFDPHPAPTDWDKIILEMTC